MKRFLMTAVIGSMPFAGFAQAATFVGTNLSGDITAALYTGQANPVVGGPLEYVFELENKNSPYWIVASTAGTPTATSNGTFSLTASSGYYISDVYMSGAGSYSFTGGGSFTASSLLKIGSDTQSATTTFTGNPLRTTSGSWALNNNPTLYYDCCKGSLSGTWSFDMSVTAASGKTTTAQGLNSATLYSAPTLHVTVSAIPEPGEWAMMLAGLSAVGLIARRRRAS